MRHFFERWTVVFASGCFGGLLNTLAVWLCGDFGVTAAFEVRIAPHLTPAFLYPRIVWGGIWGGLFLLPCLHRSIVLRGILYSLGPTLVQLFVVFPMKTHQGIMGLDLGLLTPVLVFFFNAVWGVATALWLRIAGKG
jgi:hypothetical protein